MIGLADVSPEITVETGGLTNEIARLSGQSVPVTHLSRIRR